MTGKNKVGVFLRFTYNLEHMVSVYIFKTNKKQL